jgi:hypothetical protein
MVAALSRPGSLLGTARDVRHVSVMVCVNWVRVFGTTTRAYVDQGKRARKRNKKGVAPPYPEHLAVPDTRRREGALSAKR